MGAADADDPTTAGAPARATSAERTNPQQRADESARGTRRIRIQGRTISHNIVSMAAAHYDRFSANRLLEALADTPVVALNGARQVGKSTLVGELARSMAEPVRIVTLDDQTQLEAAMADPAAFVDHRGLLVIDEVQRAPGLLPAIKAEVDRDRRPGRFLLTGSTRLLSLAEMSASLAGRVEVIDLWPLSQGELGRRREDSSMRCSPGAPSCGTRARSSRTPTPNGSAAVDSPSP
ncbi:MAG: AAA family ATPase [Acidimicrobiales bacterium]